MSTLLNLFLITFVICFFLDASGLFTFVKNLVASRLGGKYKKTQLNDYEHTT